MDNVVDGVGLHELVIPVLCFAVCILFQAWELSGTHNEEYKFRSLFQSVREGWLKENFMKGTVACNTTRDYIKTAVFFASSSITLATFTVGYSASRFADCSDAGDCSGEDWLLVIKLGVLAAVLVCNFFVFMQCTRFAVHLSFCMNTKEVAGAPMTHSLLVSVFTHAHKHYSLGTRLYFGTIPVFAWIFSSWALLAVTPIYVIMVRGLENADFVREDMDKIARHQSSLPASSGTATLDSACVDHDAAAKRA